MGPVRRNPAQRTVRTAHLSVFMTVHNSVHNTVQRTPPFNRICARVLCLFELVHVLLLAVFALVVERLQTRSERQINAALDHLAHVQRAPCVTTLPLSTAVFRLPTQWRIQDCPEGGVRFLAPKI